MSDTDKLFKRIKALFNKAENNDNEAEAEAFWDKAVSLMAEHAIDERDLNLGGDTGPAPIIHKTVKASDLWGSKPYSNSRSNMIFAIGRVLGTKVYVSRNYSGRTTRSVGLIGTEAAIERTLQVFKIADLQADRAILKARPDDYWTDVKVYRRSMFDGFTQGFLTKLKATVERPVDDGPSFGLVLVDDFKRAEQWQQENVPLGRLSSSSQTSGAGRRAGSSAGSSATIGGQGSFSGRKAIGA